MVGAAGGLRRPLGGTRNEEAAFFWLESSHLIKVSILAARINYTGGHTFFLYISRVYVYSLDNCIDVVNNEL